MSYEANVTSVTELMDAGLPPALAAGLHVVASIALASLADNCNLIVSHGATVGEVEAYRQQAADDIGAWILRHVPEVMEGVQRVIDERVAIRNDVRAMIG